MTVQDPIVLLHGQPGNARDWDRVLAQLGDEVYALALDRPGYDGVSRSGGIAHSAQAAVARMDAEGIQRATIVGLSFGGAVAAWMGVNRSERVGSLVLISAAANTASLYRVDRLLAAPIVGPALSAAMVLGASVATHAPQLRSRRAINAFLIEQRSMLRELPELEASLNMIQAPTTVVVGTADTVVDPDAGRLLASQIPGATLIEIEGAHHRLPTTHAPRIAELILNTAAMVLQ